MPAMNSRRFIRSSSQLEETDAEYQVSMVVALTAGAADQLGGHSRLVEPAASPGVIGYVAKSGNGEPESVNHAPLAFR